MPRRMAEYAENRGLSATMAVHNLAVRVWSDCGEACLSAPIPTMNGAR